MAENDKSHHGVDDKTATHYPNETMRLLLERGSCRYFLDKKIPPDDLNLILEAGIRAPTGGNLQPYSIIKIENDDSKRKLTELCGDQQFIAHAPVNLMFCIDWHRIRRWAELEIAPFTATSSFRHFWISFQDTIIAAQNICTAADAMGLGSVYVGTVLECFREIRELLGLPDGVFPVVLLSLGYPKIKPPIKKKLTNKMIVHSETYRIASDRELLAAFNDKYPDWKKDITPERLETIESVCRTVHGAKFAERCIAQIIEQGYINVVQNYFGLHYRADELPQRNDEFLKIMEEFGFRWFKEYMAHNQ